MIQHLDAAFTPNATLLQSQVAGGKLKSLSTLWSLPNSNATNSSGFSGLPGGNYAPDGGNFYSFGIAGRWWSSTSIYQNEAWCRYIQYDNAGLYREYNARQHGFSVRYIKD